MARILMSTIPVVGHITPALPVARTLVERGHEVRWHTGIAFREKVEATGAQFVRMNAAIDFTDPEIAARIPVVKHRTPLGEIKYGLKYLLTEQSLGQYRDFVEILQTFPADVQLTDFGSLGAAFTWEKGGPPWAALGLTALSVTSRDTAPFGVGLYPSSSRLGRLRNSWLNRATNDLLFRDVNQQLDKTRVGIGLPPKRQGFVDAIMSPFLYLQGTVEAFEYPRSDLPPQVHFVGPFLPDPPQSFDPPEWWHELEKSERPVIHVTQGTLSNDAEDLILPTIQALRDENMLVIATTGGKPVESVRISSLPPNLRLETFIPHAYLLPHVDVMITNGGYNGVQMALANGVPLIAAGQTEDKPEVCAHIAWSGVGINLKTKKPEPEKIREAVKQILADPVYREKARLIQAEIRKHNAPLEAAVLLEQLIVEKEPVRS